jgi:hypothetical protein
MPHAFATLRPRLRPLVAALALSIASGSALAAVRDARLDVLAARRLAHDRAAAHFAPHAPSGVPIVVENCDDSGAGSLREAYFNAGDGAQIDLTGLTCSTITLTSGPLTNAGTTTSVTLLGPGKYALAIDGNYANRVLVHNGSGALTVAGVTIRHGSYSGIYGGGCIYSYGDVLLEGAIVTGCSMSSTGTAKANGGAIYARGEVDLLGSEVSNSRAHAASANSAGGGIWANAVSMAIATISGNSASGDGSHYARGGGVYCLTDSSIEYSTFNDNEADTGGALFLVGAASYPMVIVNSTISGNRAIGAAGGVYAKYRPLGVYNSTIALNTAGFPFGAGLYLAYDTTLESSIVSGNTSGDGLNAADIGGVSGTNVTGANNLVMASTLPLPADTITLDPLLGPLQRNGGYTATHALMPGSPAIDHGNDHSGARYDQRALGPPGLQYGYERIVGPSADIGAFETGAPDHIFVDGFDHET